MTAEEKRKCKHPNWVARHVLGSCADCGRNNLQKHRDKVQFTDRAISKGTYLNGANDAIKAMRREMVRRFGYDGAPRSATESYDSDASYVIQELSDLYVESAMCSRNEGEKE